MRKQIFTAVAEALAAIPDVQFVDLWNNQVQALNGGTAFALPAVFVEFETLEWKQQNVGARRGTLGLRLHVVTRSVSTHGHNDPRIALALDVFDLLDNINAAMQGLRGTNFSGFMLTTSATNHDHAEIVENVERYVCGVQDVTAMRPMQRVPVSSVAIRNTDQ
ncbi:MAG: hypothetical protein HUK14_04890 [Muribaculaceae bacterium]|nr:hypothetical protein [Muribaculaceae bacterium]